MANRRFIDFPIATTVGDSDIILIWQSGVNKQTTKATFLSGLPENLDELNDVAISGLTNGQILRYDSVTGKWENTDQGNLDLNDLNDVSIVSPSNGQVLVYNSSTSKWENSSGGFVPYVGAVTTVDLGAQGLRAGYVRFDTSVASVPNEQGLMYWDALRSTAALIMNGTLQHIGQDTFFYVKNSSGSTIPKGTCVRFAGTDGASGHLLIVPFLANGSVPSSHFLGVTAEAITNGSFGQVMHFGELDGINTSGFTAGALLYASTTVAGGFQTTVPVAPNNIVLVAAAVNSKNNGAIVVRPTLGSNINSDEGVKITSPTTGDLLQLQAGGLWENKTLAQVIGSAYVPSTRTLTINGTAFDLSANRSWTVGDVRTDGSYSNPSWITALAWSKITGTPTTLSGYGITDAVPNSRTITINGVTQDLSANRTFNVGTVTSVGLSSATSGVTIGGSPVTGVGAFTLTIATASGSQNGLLSSTDWTTFNNKQNALTNPVTGTGTTNYLAKFTGSTTIGNSQIFDNGTNVGIGTASVSGTYEKLAVAGGISIKDNTNAKLEIGRYNTTGAQNSYIKLGANSNSLRFTNNTDIADIMELTNSGNLGLGVTPSAWGSINKVFETTAGTIMLGRSDLSAWGRNFYYNSADAGIYTGNGHATGYFQSSGQHFWVNAPSGTAGNAISFTQAMTLTSGGNLLVGTTTSGGAKLEVVGDTYLRTQLFTDTIRPYTGNQLQLLNGGSNFLYINGNVGIGTSSPERDSGTRSLAISGASSLAASLDLYGNARNFAIFTGGAGSLGFFDLTAGAERMRITSSGNVGIGTTNPNATLQVRGDNGTSVSAVLRLRDTNSTSRTTRLQFEDYNGTLADGIIDFKIPTAGSATGARLDIGVDSAIMSLVRGGNVGIGTSSPAERLHVETSSEYQITWARTGAGKRWAIGTDTAGFYFNNRTDSILPVYITNGGNVLIGTTTDFPFLGTTSLNVNRDFNSGHNIRISNQANNSSASANLILGTFGNSWVNGLGSNSSTLGNNLYWAVDASTSPLQYKMVLTTGGNVLIGTTTDSGDKLRVNGNTFTNTIMTYNPENDNRSGVAWRLGAASIGAVTPNRRLRVNVGGVEYYIGAVEV